VIFREINPRFAKRFERSVTIEPCGGYETVDPPADHILEQSPPLGNPPASFLLSQPKELSLASRHAAGAEPIHCTFVPSFVAVEKAVQENLNSAVCPAAKAGREWRPRNYRRLMPVVGHDQHSDPISHGSFKPLDKRIDLCLEAGRNVMDGGQQDSRLSFEHLAPNSSRAVQCEQDCQALMDGSFGIQRP
jgi:hypothetical protein